MPSENYCDGGSVTRLFVSIEKKLIKYRRVEHWQYPLLMTAEIVPKYSTVSSARKPTQIYLGNRLRVYFGKKIRFYCRTVFYERPYLPV